MEPSAAAPEKQPADYLNDIKVAEVTADTKTLSYTLPEDVPEATRSSTTAPTTSRSSI